LPNGWPISLSNCPTLGFNIERLAAFDAFKFDGVQHVTAETGGFVWAGEIVFGERAEVRFKPKNAAVADGAVLLSLFTGNV